MKAWVLEDIGKIQYKEVSKPLPGEHEVLVEVKAAGICGSDIPRIYQTGAHRMPLIPGHEFAGRVVQTGENTDAKWQNKRVGIFPLIPCHNCVACQKGQYELCRNYSYLGSRRDGGFAEYVAVPECNLIELPENVSYEEAAMLEPMSVACHAPRRVTGRYGCGVRSGNNWHVYCHAFIGAECEKSAGNRQQSISKGKDFKAWYQRRTIL